MVSYLEGQDQDQGAGKNLQRVLLVDRNLNNAAAAAAAWCCLSRSPS